MDRTQRESEPTWSLEEALHDLGTPMSGDSSGGAQLVPASLFSQGVCFGEVGVTFVQW